MRVVNQPQFVSLGEYRRAVDRYLDQIKNVPGVVSVYLMGGFSAPGLSDIDVIIVVDDSFSGRRSSALNPGGVNDYLFLHGPLVFPRSLAEDVQKIVYASNLQLVSGSRTLRPFESLDGDVRNLLSGIYIIDFLESRFLQYAMVKDAIDKRAWLTRSWSILHSVDILKNIDGLAIRAEEQVLLDDIRHARAAWNSSKCVSDEAFLRAFAASKSLNTSLFIRALCTLYGNVSLESSFVTRIDGRKKMIFSDDYASPLYRSRGMSFGNKSITVFECRVPPAYFELYRPS